MRVDSLSLPGPTNKNSTIFRHFTSAVDVNLVAQITGCGHKILPVSNLIEK